MHGPGPIVSPGFRVRGMLIWGLTGVLVDRLLALAGWERPWDTAKIVLAPGPGTSRGTGQGLPGRERPRESGP